MNVIDKLLKTFIERESKITKVDETETMIQEWKTGSTKELSTQSNYYINLNCLKVNKLIYE